MDEAKLRPLAEEFLVPFFSGAELAEGAEASTAREVCVAFDGPCNIEFKVHREDKYRLVLSRSQVFSSDTGGNVTEKDVVESFIDVVREIEPGLEKSYKADLLSTFQRRVVVKAIADALSQDAILEGIDQLSSWATRLYEGKPIVAAFGFLPSEAAGDVKLREICQKDFSAVLSSGFDTLVSFNLEGKIIGHESLFPPNPAPKFTPYRQALIAEWARDGRVAIVLNRLGELLIFKDKKLLFARRSGKWHFLTHEPIITQMARPQDEAVREAVYQSCLDASFARTGACIGVVISNQVRRWKEIANSPDDYLETPTSVKSKTLSKIIDGKLFQNLDRRLRQELLAVDGATLIDYQGNVLAVGAILKIPGGSTGGGRLAAAKALSKLGLGIKVSQDGGILGFQDGQDEAKFAVM